MNLFTNNT